MAFDPLGNLWVANSGGLGSLTEYSPTLVQNAGNTVTDGILEPNSIAIDGLGDIWVENNSSNVTLYTLSFSGESPRLARTYFPYSDTVFYGVAAYGQWAAFGGNGVVSVLPIADYFLFGDTTSGVVGGSQGLAMAFDSHNKLYFSNFDGTVVPSTL